MASFNWNNLRSDLSTFGRSISLPAEVLYLQIRRRQKRVHKMQTITDVDDAPVGEGDLHIALMPTVPRMKYHDAPLHFMSQPGLNQYEYEQKMLDQG